MSNTTMNEKYPDHSHNGHNAPWSSGDLLYLVNNYCSDISMDVLVERLGRLPEAIVARVRSTDQRLFLERRTLHKGRAGAPWWQA